MCVCAHYIIKRASKQTITQLEESASDRHIAGQFFRQFKKARINIRRRGSGYVIRAGVAAQIDSDVFPVANWRVRGDWCTVSGRHVRSAPDSMANCESVLPLLGFRFFCNIQDLSKSVEKIFSTISSPYFVSVLRIMRFPPDCSKTKIVSQKSVAKSSLKEKQELAALNLFKTMFTCWKFLYRMN